MDNLVKYFSEISCELGIKESQVSSVHNLLSESCTIPFIARYRKEATDNLDEIQITNIRNRLRQFEELESRKITVIKSIEEQGKMSSEIQNQINDCKNINVLEDIYLPFKPKRKPKPLLPAKKD